MKGGRKEIGSFVKGEREPSRKKPVCSLGKKARLKEKKISDLTWGKEDLGGKNSQKSPAQLGEGTDTCSSTPEKKPKEIYR